MDSERVREERVANWAVAGTCDGSFSSKTSQKQATRQSRTLFHLIVAEALPTNLWRSGSNLFLGRFHWFLDVFYWEALATHWYLSSVCSLLVAGDQYIERQHARINYVAVVISHRRRGQALVSLFMLSFDLEVRKLHSKRFARVIPVLLQFMSTGHLVLALYCNVKSNTTVHATCVCVHTRTVTLEMLVCEW